jgi:hypothetical protein
MMEIQRNSPLEKGAEGVVFVLMEGEKSGHNPLTPFSKGE